MTILLNAMPHRLLLIYLLAAAYAAQCPANTSTTNWYQYLGEVIWEPPDNPHQVSTPTEEFYDYTSCNDLIAQRGVVYKVKNNVFRTKWKSSLDTDVALVVQSSFNLGRMNSLREMIGNWAGPMSIAVFVLREYEAGARHYFETKVLGSRSNVFVHFLIPSIRSFYPYNRLRNIAITEVPTSHYIVLDVDLCHFSDNFYEKTKRWTADTGNDTGALVVPVFQPTAKENPSSWPGRKEDVVDEVRKGKLQQFKKRLHSLTHTATDYARWFKSSAPYEVVPVGRYEPYIIVKKGSPLYDERFGVGICHDRSTYTMTLAAMGFRFIVLPDVFIFHSNHPPNAEHARAFDTRDCMIEMVKQFCKELLEKSAGLKEQAKTLCALENNKNPYLSQ